jgi:general secretion pathway protein E
MQTALIENLTKLNGDSLDYATQFLQILLPAAQEARASDIHIHPLEQSIQLRWRIDGVLQDLGNFARGTKTDVIVRLKVLAELLTYRTDIPQEGRIRSLGTNVEMRVSTFPTLHGERGVIRLFSAQESLHQLNSLGMPPTNLLTLQKSLTENQGVILITGPAGAGKTTTAYACLREILDSATNLKSIVTLEDPIESLLNNVSQTQMQGISNLSLAAGLRSLLRQDPEVILVGEIRDADTASGVFQAALTGHLIVSTFHAGSAVEAIARLYEMGIERYLIRSGLQALLNQRLIRKLCSCATWTESADALLELPLETLQVKQSGKCPACLHVGYAGRMLLVEMLARHNGTLPAHLFEHAETQDMQQVAEEIGMITLFQAALQAVKQGLTSPVEVRRVLGFSSRA